MAEYIGEHHSKGLARKVEGCGEYLLFRHYFTIDEVRLHAAFFCRKHLICPLCAIRRGAKAMQAYLPRFEAISAARPDLRPFLVTLTVKDGPDLAERFQHLLAAQRELWKRRHRRVGCWSEAVEGAVWSYEVKRGAGSGLWHPHLHMVAMARQLDPEGAGNLGQLSAEWHAITGDSFMVDVRPIEQSDPASGFLEVFKYAVKFSTMEPADLLSAFGTLSGRRLVGSAGLFRGVEIPDQLTDEPLDDLPYADHFFRFVDGAYSRGPVRRRSEPSEHRAPPAGGMGARPHVQPSSI